MIFSNLNPENKSISKIRQEEYERGIADERRKCQSEIDELKNRIVFWQVYQEENNKMREDYESEIRADERRKFADKLLNFRTCKGEDGFIVKDAILNILEECETKGGAEE